MTTLRAQNLHMASLAEEAQRWDDLSEIMLRVANMDTEMNSAERNYLSIAFKNSIQSRRHAWNQVDDFLKRSEEHSPSLGGHLITYRTKMLTEMEEKCNGLFLALATLIASASDIEAKVFYQKMEGDYHRYLAQCASPSHAQNAEIAYSKATETAVGLPKSNAVRLGLALNFSVFYHELHSDIGKAAELVQSAVSLSAQDLQLVQQDEAALDVYELLKQNMALWQVGAAGGTYDTSVEDL